MESLEKLTEYSPVSNTIAQAAQMEITVEPK